jgi:hypothetical protein
MSNAVVNLSLIDLPPHFRLRRRPGYLANVAVVVVADDRALHSRRTAFGVDL